MKTIKTAFWAAVAGVCVGGWVWADSVPMASMGMGGAAPASAAPVAPTGTPVATGTLTMFPQFMGGDFFARNWMKTVPHGTKLSETKPDAITKEPKYKGKPLYGSVHFGDDASAPATWMAMDDDAGRVYIDTNQDGDLTNDNYWTWDKSTKTDAVKAEDGTTKAEAKVYVEGGFTFPANWKTGPGKYGIKMYRDKGATMVWWQTVGAPTGVITLDGKTYATFVYDPSGTGIYNNVYSKDTKVEGAEIFIDTDGDGLWRPIGHSEDTSIGRPMQIGDHWYLFNLTADGHTLTAFATEAPPESKIPPVVMKAAGDKAPDFAMTLPDGKTVHLSDYKGKTVVLDMWATWCGPCQAAMPSVEKMWKSVKSQDDKVAFIGLCVADEKPAFDKWIKEKTPKSYSFTFGYDPVGNSDATKSAEHAYGVSGIPSTFVIDPTGTIVEAFSGYTEENEPKVPAALSKLGIKPQ